MDEGLLNIAKDCFYFVTRFFEPINISATHIYHSALEQSPLSSIVRGLYYHKRPTPFPRTPLGIPDLWDPSIAISKIGYSSETSTWSPCGQFIAVRTGEVTEIRDQLTFELLSTLQPTEPSSPLTGVLAYAPDGQSLACVAHTSIIIWDVQTGGVAREIQGTDTYDVSLVWSLDGRMISTLPRAQVNTTWTVGRYDVVSGTEISPIILHSETRPLLWAHGESFRAMMIVGCNQVPTIEIFKVGPTLTKVESFLLPHINITSLFCSSGGYKARPNPTFSPTTYHISVSRDRWLHILDIRNSKYLLDVQGEFFLPCFSSDGSQFAASCQDNIWIWRYNGSHYIPWGQFQHMGNSNSHFLLSPTSPSVLGGSWNLLKLQHMGGSFPTPTTSNHLQLSIFSYSGTYIVTANYGESTITITNLLSQNSFLSIDTGLRISAMALIGNILLVVDLQMIVAWLLTEEGLIKGVLDKHRADYSDSIWAVPMPEGVMFWIQGQTGVIKSDWFLHIYNIKTGEVLEPAQVPLLSDGLWYSYKDIFQGWRHLYDNPLCNTPLIDNWEPPKITLEGGWVKDHEGKHLLWITAEWVVMADRVGWLPNIGMMWFETQRHYPLIIKLY